MGQPGPAHTPHQVGTLHCSEGRGCSRQKAERGRGVRQGDGTDGRAGVRSGRRDAEKNRREGDPHQGWRLKQEQRDPGQERPLVPTMGVGGGVPKIPQFPPPVLGVPQASQGGASFLAQSPPLYKPRHTNCGSAAHGRPRDIRISVSDLATPPQTCSRRKLGYPCLGCQGGSAAHRLGPLTSALPGAQEAPCGGVHRGCCCCCCWLSQHWESSGAVGAGS